MNENDIVKVFSCGCKCIVQLNNNNKCFAGGIPSRLLYEFSFWVWAASFYDAMPHYITKCNDYKRTAKRT